MPFTVISQSEDRAEIIVSDGDQRKTIHLLRDPATNHWISSDGTNYIIDRGKAFLAREVEKRRRAWLRKKAEKKGECTCELDCQDAADEPFFEQGELTCILDAYQWFKQQLRLRAIPKQEQQFFLMLLSGMFGAEIMNTDEDSDLDYMALAVATMESIDITLATGEMPPAEVDTEG